MEGINRAGQLESTCDTCAMVTDGSPVNGRNELDPIFPQFTTNSNGLGARHNADQCFACHAQPGLGGAGGFLVPAGTRVRLILELMTPRSLRDRIAKDLRNLACVHAAALH